MGLGRTLLLGAIAGVTILIGMPLGRLRQPAVTLRLLLNALAIGILLFLTWDVLTHAYAPIDGALANLREHKGGLAPVVGYATVFATGLSLGLMSLIYYERFMARNRGGGKFGPGTMAVAELQAQRLGIAGWTPARRLSLMIAVGIGLHNFGEGLAIGGSAGRGEIGLATLLVVGFGLHNATEGFGIVAPLAADRTVDQPRPSWGFLLMLGAIGGAPTFIGTAIGHEFTSDVLSVAFLTLAAGSILYVIIQLLGLAAKSARKDLLGWGLLAGLMAGFITDFVVTAGGA